MATYKVLQDIEAEDKLLGPLTLKQFIFAAITIGMGFLCFMMINSGAPIFLKVPFVMALLVPMAVLGFLAAPISREQPNDIWLLARLRFLFKPRQRIWDQDGMSELVTITAPKRVVHTFTDGLSQIEVKSRLSALANTLDSRGWAVKNVDTNLFAQPGYLSNDTDSDRLVAPSSLPQDVPTADISAADDILDTTSNSTAQHLDQLVQASTQAHLNQAISGMRSDPATQQQTPQDYWFLNQPSPNDNKPAHVPSDYSTFQNQPVVAPGSTDDAIPDQAATEEEQAIGKRLAAEHDNQMEHVSDHMKVIQPLHNPDGSLTAAALPPLPPVSIDGSVPPPVDNQRQTTPNPAILGLASNDDLNVATIARQANQLSKDDGEVVISLH